jgi:hypothetical protein
VAERNDGSGIDISTGGNRIGGVPTHVTTRPVAAPGRATPAPAVLAGITHRTTTLDPFAFIGRARRALGKRLSG